MSGLRAGHVLVVSIGLALTAAGCDEQSAPAGDELVFQSGTPSELALAEELAMDHLFDSEGPALPKGIDEVRVLKNQVDDLGFAHTRVQQLHQCVPVFGGEAIVHLDGRGKLFALTDDFVPGIDVDVAPLYSADEAADIAAEDHYDGWAALTADPTVELVILRREGVDYLTYKVQLERLDGVVAEQPLMFIDAHTGDLVWGFENLKTATCSGATNYYGTVSFECLSSGGSYYTENGTEGVATYSYNNTTASLYYVSSTSTTFSTSSAVTRNAVEAQYVANNVNDYFWDTFGRNGIDGSGGPAAITSHGYSYISSYTSYSSKYVNAYWDGTAMTYGDGDGVYSGSLTMLDVGGHEFTHGVTEATANLTYSGEPGHLNESMSDVFGAMVERSVLGESSDTWLIGEDGWTPGTSGDALRYMNDPADDGYSYDYYTSGIGSVDVHYGSGVPNLAFYLLSEGGTHPRGKSTVSVTGIGADEASAIWYKALASYMTSSTSFSGARTAMLSAASSLYGSSSTEYAAVQDSWAAVGVGSSSSGGGTGGTTCTTATYSGSLSRSGRSAYQPSSSGLSVSGTDQTLTLTGPSSADFDVYLQKKSGSSWSNVASGTGSTSSESVSYTGTSGTYRVRVYSYSGSGSYNLSWCK